MSDDGQQLAPITRDDGSIDERETVFQVWAFLCDRSPTRTAEKAMLEFGILARPKTISEWSRRYNWHARAMDLARDAAPDYFDRTRFSLVGAGPAAANYVKGVAEGSAEPDRVRVLAAFGILDRIGFLPHTRREAEHGKTPAGALTPSGDEWVDVPEDELRAIVAGRLS